MLKKKILVLSSTLMVGLGSLLATSGVSAESINELRKQQDKIQEQKSGVQSTINETEAVINQLQVEQEQINAEIKRIDMAVEKTNAEIREKNAEIATTNQEIEKLKAEIIELQERIAKRTEILKERAVAFQQSGGSVSYLEVLLGSTSFGDFISRVSAVSTIMEADETLVKKHEEDKAALETAQKSVEEKLASLEAMKAELEVMKAQLDAQRAEKAELMKKLEQEEEEAHNHVLALEEETEILAAQEEAIAQAIALEKKRQAEEAARKRAEEEARKNQSGGTVSNETPVVSSGSFMRPAVGRVSSGFGSRWGSTHYGIDIANSSDVPIVAAASGVVIKSYYSPSYGNAIFIAHSIGGQTWTTVYAHMETRFVSSGQTVSKGEQIGIMGNTGQSTGQHLHFELHKGSWTASKGNAVNPANYISF